MHGIPFDPTVTKPRINLTWRWIVNHFCGVPSPLGVGACDKKDEEDDNDHKESWRGSSKGRSLSRSSADLGQTLSGAIGKPESASGGARHDPRESSKGAESRTFRYFPRTPYNLPFCGLNAPQTCVPAPAEYVGPFCYSFATVGHNGHRSRANSVSRPPAGGGSVMGLALWVMCGCFLAIFARKNPMADS